MWVMKMDNIMNNDLIKKLKEKDAKFVLFCQGLYGTNQKKTRVALEEDLVFFLQGAEEIGEIIEEIEDKINTTTDEEEKNRLYEERLVWIKQRGDYYQEINRIKEEIKKYESEDSWNNINEYFNDENIYNYSRIIYLVTVYDEQKKKVALDGRLSNHELEKLVEVLHSIQDKLNMLYQKTFHTKDLLEEKDAIPRMKNDAENEEDYKKYLVDFYQKKDSLVEEQKQEKEENESYDKQFAFDFWLEHYSSISSSILVQKIMSSQDEKLRPFVSMLQVLTPNGKTTEKDNHIISLLKNYALKLEAEVVDFNSYLRNLDRYNQDIQMCAADLIPYYSNNDIINCGLLSSLFQCIYLYDKTHQKVLVNPQDKSLKEKENQIVAKTNELAKTLLNIDDLFKEETKEEVKTDPVVTKNDDYEEFEFWLENYDEFKQIPELQKLSSNKKFQEFYQFYKRFIDYHDIYEFQYLKYEALRSENEIMSPDVYKNSLNELNDTRNFKEQPLLSSGYTKEQLQEYRDISNLFQFIYTYHKLKMEKGEDDEKVVELASKINEMAVSILGVSELISNKNVTVDSLVELMDSSKEDEKEDNYTLVTQNLENELNASISQEEVPVVLEEPYKDHSEQKQVSNEEYEHLQSLLDEEKQNNSILTTENEILHRNMEDLQKKLLDRDREVEQLKEQLKAQKEEMEEIKQKLQASRSGKGKVYRVVRKAADNLVHFVNRRKALTAAIVALTISMLASAGYSISRKHEYKDVPPNVVESVHDALHNGVIVEPVHLDFDDVPNNVVEDVVHLETEEPTISSPSENIVPTAPTIDNESNLHLSAEEILKNANVPGIGDLVTVNATIRYNDGYVDKDSSNIDAIDGGSRIHSFGYAENVQVKAIKLCFWDEKSGTIITAKSNEEAARLVEAGYPFLSFGYNFNLQDTGKEFTSADIISYLNANTIVNERALGGRGL